MRFEYLGLAVEPDGETATMTWALSTDQGADLGEHGVEFMMPGSGTVQDAVRVGYRALRDELQSSVDWIDDFLNQPAP